VIIRQLAPAADAVIGMSLGGKTAIALQSEAPELVRKLVLVDILPGANKERSRHIADFINGPTRFDDLEALLDRTADFNPKRTRSSLRRGILHNAEQQPDGSWVWRWARHSPGARVETPGAAQDKHLWKTVSQIRVPLLLARGMRPDSVLGDEDEDELRRRLPSAEVVRVEEAGHSLQGDAPLELAAIIEQFVFGN
jgi:pimeloyl-ACP methyl ester carboxylesterase